MTTSKTKKAEPASILTQEDMEPKNIKARITICLDLDVLDKARELAKEQHIGYQTLINQTLRTALFKGQSSRDLLISLLADIQDINARVDVLESVAPAEKKRA